MAYTSGTNMNYSQDRPSQNTFIMEYPENAPFDSKLEDDGRGASHTLQLISHEPGSIVNPERHMCILVLGPSGSGKSTFIAKASGMLDSDRIIGHGLDSHTASCTPYTFTAKFTQPSSAPRPSDPVSITLIDTPGFNDTSRNDLDILQTLASFLAAPSTPILTGIIFTHRITDNRVTGSCRLNLDIIKALAGEGFFPHVAMLTTMWDTIPSRTAYDACNEREGQIVSSVGYWGGVAAKGGRDMRFHGTSESAEQVLRYFYELSFDTKAVPRVQLQRELDRGVELSQTAAGMVILEERRRREKKMEEELEEMREEEEARLREERVRLELAASAAAAAASGNVPAGYTGHDGYDPRHDEGRRHSRRHGYRDRDGAGRGPHVGQYQNVQGQMLYGGPVGQQTQLTPTLRGRQGEEGIVDRPVRIFGFEVFRVREARR